MSPNPVQFGPQPRAIAPEVAARLRRWVSLALRLDERAQAQLEVSQWQHGDRDETLLVWVAGHDGRASHAALPLAADAISPQHVLRALRSPQK